MLQVLAMCFVRKLLDYVFSRHELRWLDDILPESHKKEKEDKKKRKDADQVTSPPPPPPIYISPHRTSKCRRTL